MHINLCRNEKYILHLNVILFNEKDILLNILLNYVGAWVRGSKKKICVGQIKNCVGQKLKVHYGSNR